MKSDRLAVERNHLDTMSTNEQKAVRGLVAITAMVVWPVDERSRRIQTPFHLAGKWIPSFTKLPGCVFAADAPIRADPYQAVGDKQVGRFDVAFPAGCGP